MNELVVSFFFALKSSDRLDGIGEKCWNLRFPGAICGRRSVRGVVQLTPFRFRVAFV